ncbi:hypothetical protein EON65_29290 [archaeon]|nr:MAG: hypothetical protein EON65_29290 [archaeon]
MRNQLAEDAQHARSSELMQLMTHMVKNPPPSALNSSSMDAYISARLASAGQPGSVLSHRILSSLLTFPLTLSHALSTLFPHPIPKLNIVVLGARSEASLPASWWREVMYSSPPHIQEVCVKMVGPGQKHLKNHPPLQQTLTWTSSESTQRSMTLETGKDISLLHDLPHCHQLLMEANLFVLFHPGFGTESVQPLWHPTLQMLWHTRKPVFCTAYSPSDLQKDLQYLRNCSQDFDDQDLGESYEFLMPAKQNPFASKKAAITEDSEEITLTNYYSYCFQSK